MQQKLDRSLGLFSCLTISTGTMIGSAIFVLAGISFEVAGPSASLSVFLSGIAALFTALSFAELVTFIPTAGGGYAYVREATNNGILGFICGWGFWLGYAMSCGLFALGFGNFLNYFFPFIPQLVGSYLLIIYVIFTNIKGVKNSGNLQNIITVGLILLLVGYIVYGAFFIDMDNQTPYLTQGLSGTFKAMGFLYMTYIGYGLITTASEEVIAPEKTIPKAIIVSVVLVIFIKTATFFIGSSILHWSNLTPGVTNTPMIDTAIQIGGRVGGYLFALAGILATLSSINTAVMASSRTSFALARDKRFPPLFKKIHPGTKTPIFSIVATGLIVVIATTIRDLEHISTVTSIFSLTGYSLVNVALIIFRKKLPNEERKFKVPFYPITPILGIIINIFMVTQLMISDIFALVIAVIITVVGILYYYVLIPKLKEGPKGITPQIIPSIKANENNIDYAGDYNVLVPISNPKTIKPIIELGLNIAQIEDGKIIPIHILNVAESIPLDSRYTDLKVGMENYDELLNEIESYSKDVGHKTEPLLILSRDTSHAIVENAKTTKSKLVILGWHHSGFAHKMIGGVVPKVLEEVKNTVAIFKPGKNKDIKKILLPYSGGVHSQGAIKLLEKIARAYNAEVTLLRVSKDSLESSDYNEIKNVLLEGLQNLGVKGSIKVVEDKSIKNTIVEESKNHDLVILGATSEWGLSNNIAGYRTDKIMEKIECSGLVIREYSSVLHKKGIRYIFNRVKKM